MCEKHSKQFVNVSFNPRPLRRFGTYLMQDPYYTVFDPRQNYDPISNHLKCKRAKIPGSRKKMKRTDGRARSTLCAILFRKSILGTRDYFYRSHSCYLNSVSRASYMFITSNAWVRNGTKFTARCILPFTLPVFHTMIPAINSA